MREHEPRGRVLAEPAQHGPEDQSRAPAVAPPASALPLAGVATRDDGLVVGRADDPAEARADQLADAALARLSLHTAGTDGIGDADVHRHAPGCGHLRRAATPTTSPGAAVGPSGGPLGGTLSRRIEAVRGGGSRLAGRELTRMESAFGRPLDHVRVHRGGEAARLSDAISAEAFTVGSDVFLGPRSEGPAAEGVLAHEIAHVLSESGEVRRLVVRRSPSPAPPTGPSEEEQEKRAKEESAAARAAEKQRAKDTRKARKTAAKGSKKTEKAEQRSLKQARERGVKGREHLKGEIYDRSGGVDESGSRTKELGAQFKEALKYEAGLFSFLTLNRGRRGGGALLSEDEAADRAYHETWFVRFPQLESVRPPRETAAERLVIQVRQVRAEGAIQQQQLDDDTASDKAVISLRMLGKDIEAVYERMAVLRDELVAKDPKLHPALAQSEAADTVRADLDEKLADKMPPKDGPLDMAAWGQATDRVAAKQRQAKRDRDTIETSLALLPADKQQEKRQALDATPATYEKGKEDKLAKGEGIVGDIKTYGGAALTGIKSIGGGIAGFIGKKQDKKLREEQGVEKASYGPVLPSQVDQGVSQAVRDARQAEDWHSKGQVKGPGPLPTSTATKVQTGFGTVTGILTSLLGAVQSAFAMVRSAKLAWENDDVYEGLKATKSGAAGLDGLVGAAKQTANLAKLIDSGVAGGVSQVVPGLDIVSAVLSIVRATMDVATLGMRQRETDVSMFEARARTTSKVYVTVYPLMQVSQVYTKQLENACWTLGSGIGDLVISIAQVASGGGYGIPLAVKSGKAVLDNLHSLGHYIADTVLAVMAKRAQKESEVMHLEGAAEQELSKHPKMAVDGLVIRAAQGDPVALAFLAHYRIDGKPITADYVKQIKPSSVKPGADPGEDGGQSMLLAKIRTAVLGSMNTSADPKTAYDDIMGYVDKVTGVKKKGAEALTTWKDTRALAEQRNQLAKQGRLGATTKSNRGLGWRIRMFVRTEKRGKLAQQTTAYEDYVPLPRGILCVIGDQPLSRHTSNDDLDAWVDKLTLADLEAELARKPRRNPPEAIELIRDLIRLKTSGAGAAGGASGSTVTASASSGAGA